MKEKIRFTKMHGCGNDYIYINIMEYEIADPQCAAMHPDASANISLSAD